MSQPAGGERIPSFSACKQEVNIPLPKAKRRFEYKLNLGKSIDGTLIRRSFYSTRSLSDAKRKAEEFRVQYEMELCVNGSGWIKPVKFSAWALSCLELYKKPYVKANTYNGTYLAPVKYHLNPYFGERMLNEIRPIHIQQYINVAAKKYAPETLKKDMNALNLIFSTAVDNQLCSRSPMTKSIKLPRDETRVEKRAFTQEQYNMAYQFAKEWEDGLSIMVMLETGVSRSELLGLRWSDLDEENQCIQIREGLVVYHSVEQDKQVMEKSGLKNKFRRRSIPITDDELWERLLRAPPDRDNGEEDHSHRRDLSQPGGEALSTQQLGEPCVPPFYAGTAYHPSGDSRTVPTRTAPHESHPLDCPGDGSLHGRKASGAQ